MTPETDRTTMADALGPQLRHWMLGQPDQPGDDALMRSISATTASLQQHRSLRTRLVVRDHGDKAQTSRSVRRATSDVRTDRTRRMLAIGLIALLGGGVIAVEVASVPARRVAPHELPLLGDVIPAGVESGTLESNLGPIPWVDLPGTEVTQPDSSL